MEKYRSCYCFSHCLFDVQCSCFPKISRNHQKGTKKPNKTILERLIENPLWKAMACHKINLIKIDNVDGPTSENHDFL